MILDLDVIPKHNDSSYSQTIAHELGHNLGMEDQKNHRGKNCSGYMDYNDGTQWGNTQWGNGTNKWSHCSVSDLTSYVNKQVKQHGSFCLQPLRSDCVLCRLMCDKTFKNTFSLDSWLWRAACDAAKLIMA